MFNVKCSSLNYYLAILDKDTLLCLLHTTAREVVDGSFPFSVFTFQFVNACLIVRKDTGHLYTSFFEPNVASKCTILEQATSECSFTKI